MTTLITAADFDLYALRGFFQQRMCDAMVAEMHSALGGSAPVYGPDSFGSVDERVRKVMSQTPSRETVEFVRHKLLECMRKVEEHFCVSLTSCEEPQFLRYRVGDFFVAHQDGNTGLMLSEREQSRKISVVILLNRQSETPEPSSYGGGSLVFTEWRPGRNRGEFWFSGETGTLVAFPSETTHEVRPVTHGERYSIVSWFG